MNDLREMIDALAPVQNVPKEKPKVEDLCKRCRNPRFPYSGENGNFGLKAVEDVEMKDANKNSPSGPHADSYVKPPKGYRVLMRDSQEDGVQLHALLDEREGEEYYRMFSSPRSRRGQRFKPHIHKFLSANSSFSSLSQPSPAHIAQTISSWLDTCSESHDECQDHSSFATKDQIPKRLIYVGSVAKPRVRVVKSPEIQFQYVALSYCWGYANPCVLESKTLSQFGQGVPWEDLPETIQDAIKLTRELKVPYLWVDALCIVQNNQEDWLTDSVKMKDIYSKAQLVLSADRGESCDAGFLHPRRDSSVTVKVASTGSAEIALWKVGGWSKTSDHEASSTRSGAAHEEMHKFVIPHSGEVFRSMDLAGSSISQRAWCLQEQLLATRFVNCTESEMLWECLHDAHCECGGVDEYKSGAEETLRTYRGTPRKASWNKLRKSFNKEDALSSRWSYASQYSASNLTKNEDTFPAISGIAQEMPSHLLGRYYAGIWKHDLPVGLLWGLVGVAYGDPAPSLPLDFIAPTWSWASVRGRIYGPGIWRPVAKVMDVKCTTATPNPYGRLIKAVLTLQTTFFDIHAFAYADIYGDGSAKRAAKSSNKLFSFVAFEVEFYPGKIKSGKILDSRRKEPGEGAVIGKLRSGEMIEFSDKRYGEYALNEHLNQIEMRCVIIGRDFSEYGTEIFGCLLVAPSAENREVFTRIGIVQISFSKPWRFSAVKSGLITLI